MTRVVSETDFETGYQRAGYLAFKKPDPDIRLQPDTGYLADI